MTPATTAAFHARWHGLKRAFDAEAPALARGWFATLPPAERERIVALVVAGKSARGLLSCLVCEALGGTFGDALPRAVAIECLQAASLVHDDVVDADVERRGAPAQWLTLGARRAVLLGDVMFATMLSVAARRSRDDLLVLADAIATVAAGAFVEPFAGDERGSGTVQGAGDVYDHVIHCKTGALFGAAAALGAVAASAPHGLRHAAFAFGARVGEAYQIADDIADLIVAPRTWPAGGESTLAAIVSRFLAARGEAAQERTPDGHPFARLRPGLEREIDRRVRQAREALDAFPSSAPTLLLHAAPGYIIGLQGAAG